MGKREITVVCQTLRDSKPWDGNGTTEAIFLLQLGTGGSSVAGDVLHGGGKDSAKKVEMGEKWKWEEGPVKP